MKPSILLPLVASVALSAAFVIPDEPMMQRVVTGNQQRPLNAESDQPKPLKEKLDMAMIIAPEPCHKKLKGLKNLDALERGHVLKHYGSKIPGTHIDLEEYTAFNPTAWLDSTDEVLQRTSPEMVFFQYRRKWQSGRHHPGEKGGREGEHPPPPHHGDRPPPGHDHDHDGDKKPKHPPPHHGPPHHHKPNETIWQLISKSKYTTKLAKLISKYDDLVDVLNGTASNYTLFAPTDYAFEKLERHGNHSDHKPSKEMIKNFISYHLSPDFYPAGRVLTSHTIPSSLDSKELGGPQRLRVGLGPRGLAVNFYSRIIAIDIFATNGVIHGLDSVLFPPPEAFKIISFLPSTFSTFELAVSLTNLTEVLPEKHTGGTLFAPSNDAFKRLGPRLNAFLFSSYGRKYLKALLLYHIVVNETLYSDAYYHPTVEQGTQGVERATGIPKGRYHVDLPTLLEGKHLSIDIARFGGLIDITINGYVKVAVQDGIAKDGVIQVLRNVLIPPKKPGESQELDSEMSVEEFKDRFSGIVEVTEEDKGYREEDVLIMWDH